MRVLHVTPTYLPAVRYGGPIWAVDGLCRALARLGHEVTVFTTNVDGSRDSDVPLGRGVDVGGVEVFYFPSHALRRIYWSPEMGRALHGSAPDFDLVHLHSIFLWTTWAAARAARAARRPYVLTPHGMLVRDLVDRRGRARKLTWIRLVEARNIEAAAALHVTTTAEAVDAAAFGLRLPPIHVVPFGVDLSVPGDTCASPGPPIVLFLGRLSWKKGLDVLVEAMAEVPAARLVIAGNDEEGQGPSLRRLAERRGVASRMSLVGPIHGVAKRDLLRSATVFVLPSRGENFSLAVLEAMAAGLPVVVSPEVGLAPVVEEEGAGRVVERNPKRLGECLRALLADAPARSRMSVRGRTAASRFSWESVARRMDAAMQEAVDRHRAHA